MLKKVSRALLARDEHGDSWLSVIASGVLIILFILAVAALLLTAPTVN